jgi:hypothetical protein
MQVGFLVLFFKLTVINGTKITGQSKFTPAKAWNMTAHQLGSFLDLPQMDHQ